MRHGRWFLAAAALLVFLTCSAPRTASLRWPAEAPPVLRSEDRFTLKVLELDAAGRPKSPAQWAAVLAAADQAQDAVLFMHGWRRDARDQATMEAFLKIYRGAFECLAQRDVEGSEACRAIHGFCHPASPASKLVVLLLWDGRSSVFGFKTMQRRALALGPGLKEMLESLHGKVHGRGTLLVMGHSLGGTALASALGASLKEGHAPLDGALLVAGAFDAEQFASPAKRAPRQESPALLVNLFNRKDGYLRLHRWIYGGATAGETGLRGYPVTPGSPWVQEGRSCGSGGATSFGASLFEAGAADRALDILNMDATGLVRGHVDIEDEASLRIYNRVAAEMHFQILWNRAFNPAGVLP